MKIHASAGRGERGSALLTTLIFSISCAALACVMIRQGFGTKAEADFRWASTQRLYLARAGIANAFMSFRAGTGGALGSAGAKVAFGQGAYYVEAVTNADATVTLTSHGWYGGQSASVRAVINDVAKPIFDHSMYAGNSSGDPNYDLKFGGTGAQADQIGGDIYSGRNILVTGTPAFTGAVRAAGTITGTTGTYGNTQPGPSLASMHYETTADVMVAQEFATGGATYTTNLAFGGAAYELPQNNAAHIFRKNPTDRSNWNLGTTKDDYYLEDPYQTVNASTITDALYATPVGLRSGNGHHSGNHVVYYIDGNLWVNNLYTYSFKLTHTDPGGVQVTFVVKGNVYMGDNIIYQDPAKDGVAIIAMKDPAVADSGNIYFGDSVFGTLEEMDAFMYAENNFVDQNLNAGGSAHITVKGTMSAGNQVAINRDFGSSHTRMDLTFDPRVKNHTLTMPGLPALLAGTQVPQYVVATQWGIGQ